eukprot:SAG22_NODE_2491_length_2514_cov_1.004969_1_plen_173_part_10
MKAQLIALAAAAAAGGARAGSQRAHVPFAHVNISVAHYTANLTGCGTVRSCGSMGAAPIGLPAAANGSGGHGLPAHGVAFAGGSGLGGGQAAAVGDSPPYRGLPDQSKLADALRFGGQAGVTVTPLPAMPFPHAGDANAAAELMGLSFFAGGGGSVSVWNSTAGAWLAKAWPI